MNLSQALRLGSRSVAPIVSFTGSGGKTTALFQLARQLSNFSSVLVTATSHLGIWQTSLADHHRIAKQNSDLENLPSSGVTLITGERDGERTKPVNEIILNWLRAKSKTDNLPLLIEADGSRQKPLKAPAPHEPAIPSFAEIVVHVVGMSGLGKPLKDQHVHRAEIFSELTGLALGETVTTEPLVKLLLHPQGGLKDVPANARHIVLLNQADTPELQSIGGSVARQILNAYDAVILGSLQQNNLQVAEKTAGIILAAGSSSRYGQPKQLLEWKGKSFIRHVTETALRSALEPVVVVTGFQHAEIESQLQDLPVNIVYNAGYEQGQSTSIKAGISALPENVGAAVFLLADQPQIPVEVIRALVESHTSDLQAILAPLVLEEKRANPVLFDRVTFPSLLSLQGDVGGRGIFDKHKVSYLPWHDDILIFDVDKPEDYERLKRIENSEW